MNNIDLKTDAQEQPVKGSKKKVSVQPPVVQVQAVSVAASGNNDLKSKQLILQPARSRQRKMLFSNMTKNNQIGDESPSKSSQQIEPSKIAQSQKTSLAASQDKAIQKPKMGIDVQSVISEEEDGIMSSGGLIEEDSINQSVVYRSSIQNVKRKLPNAEHQEEVKESVCKPSLISDPSDHIILCAQNKEVTPPIASEASEIKAAKPVIGFLKIEQMQSSNFEQRQTPAFQDTAILESLYQPAQQTEQQNEQLVSVANFTTESEVEAYFYSEGLSNHATSYQPCQTEIQSNNNRRETLINGSIEKSQVSQASGGSHDFCANCYTDGVSLPPPARQQRQRVANAERRNTTKQNQINRFIMVNDLASNGSSVYDIGDTGGQRQTEKGLASYKKRSQPGRSHEAQQIVRVQINQIPPIKEIFETGYLRYRSTEVTQQVIQERRVSSHSAQEEQDKAHLLVEKDKKNKPRNDSSGGTKPTHMENRVQYCCAQAGHFIANNDQLQRVRVESQEATDNLNSKSSDPTEQQQDVLAQFQSPPDAQIIVQQYKDQPDVDNVTDFNLQQTGSQTTMTTQEAQLLYEFCLFISKRKSIKATKSTGRRILDALATNKEYRQRMSSFQDRSTDQNNIDAIPPSRNPKTSETTRTSQSRQRQLLAKTVESLVKHQNQQEQNLNERQKSAELSPQPLVQTEIISSIGSHTGSGKSLKTSLRLETIFNAILKQDLEATKKDNNTIMQRKFAIWALCLIVIVPRAKFQGLPEDLAEDINRFRDDIDSRNPFGGKVQMNQIPTRIKKMIAQDSNMIKRLRFENYQLAAEKRIWTFPKFEPQALNNESVSQISEILKVAHNLPDPNEFCVGIYLYDKAESQQQLPQFMPKDVRTITISVDNTRSDSSNWINTQQQNQRAASQKLAKKKSSRDTSRDTHKRSESQLDIANEEYDQSDDIMRGFTEIELTPNKMQHTKIDTTQESHVNNSKSISSKIPVQSPRTPGQSVLYAKIMRPSPVTSFQGKVPKTDTINGGRLTPKNLNFKANTAMTKYPQRPVTMMSVSGRKTTTNKTSLVHPGMNEKKRSQESVALISQQAAQNRRNAKVSQSTKISIGQLIKSMPGQSSQQQQPQQPSIKIKQLPHLTERMSHHRNMEINDQRKISVTPPMKYNTMKSNGNQMNDMYLQNLPTAQPSTTTSVAKASFTSRTQQLPKTSTTRQTQWHQRKAQQRTIFEKIPKSTIKNDQNIKFMSQKELDNLQRKKQGSFTERYQKQNVAATHGVANTTDQNKHHSNSFVTPQSKSKPFSSSSFTKNVSGDYQPRQPPKISSLIQRAVLNSSTATSAKQKSATISHNGGKIQAPSNSKQRSANLATRAKTSLETNLVSRVVREGTMKPPTEERKASQSPPHQQDASSSQRNRPRRQQTELSQIIKIASDMKSSQQPSFNHRRRKADTQVGLPGAKAGVQTERHRRNTAVQQYPSSRTPQRMKQAGEYGGATKTVRNMSNANSSSSSLHLLEQIDEHACASDTVAKSTDFTNIGRILDTAAANHLSEKKPTSLISSLHTKLKLPLDRLNMTPNSKNVADDTSNIKNAPDQQNIHGNTNLIEYQHQNSSLRSTITGPGLLMGQQQYTEHNTPVIKKNLKQLLSQSQRRNSSCSSSRHSAANKRPGQTAQQPQAQSSQSSHQGQTLLKLATSSTQQLSARSTTGGPPSSILPKKFIQL